MKAENPDASPTELLTLFQVRRRRRALVACSYCPLHVASCVLHIVLGVASCPHLDSDWVHSPLPACAPGLGSATAQICTGTGAAHTARPCDCAHPLHHDVADTSPLHGDRARCRPGLALGARAHGRTAAHICARSRIGSELPDLHPGSGLLHRQRDWAGSLAPGLFRICSGMGSPQPRPNVHWDCFHLAVAPPGRPTPARVTASVCVVMCAWHHLARAHVGKASDVVSVCAQAAKKAAEEVRCDASLPVMRSGCDVHVFDADAPCCTAA